MRTAELKLPVRRAALSAEGAEGGPVPAIDWDLGLEEESAETPEISWDIDVGEEGTGETSGEGVEIQWDVGKFSLAFTFV